MTGFNGWMVLALAISVFSVRAIAQEYDPDGFHECILEHVKGEMGGRAVTAIRQSCAHMNGTDTVGNQKDQPRSKSSGQSMSILDTIRQRNPSLRNHSDEQIKLRIRDYPEFSTFSNEQFDRYVTGDYEER